MANMADNKIIIAIILAIVIVAGILAAVMFMQPQGPQNVTTEDTATKLAFYNNGTTWLHLDVVMENVTLKNGTTQNFYAQIFLKPSNGTAVIDLSNLTGYGKEKLPAGTNITILAWKGLLMPANTTLIGSTADLNLNMQGWSNTGQPGTDDAIVNVFFPQLNITQLPTISGNPITDDTVIIKTVANDFTEIVPAVFGGQEPIFEQEVLTVDQNGKVTITILQAPTLCRLVA